jgi:hypothetical protein
MGPMYVLLLIWLKNHKIDKISTTTEGIEKTGTDKDRIHRILDFLRSFTNI